jgi:hypothetical protein
VPTTDTPPALYPLDVDPLPSLHGCIGREPARSCDGRVRAYGIGSETGPTMWFCDNHSAQRLALGERFNGRPIPKALRDLRGALDRKGWRWAQVVGRDTGGAVYVTIEAVRRDRKLRVTWHSRPTDGRALRLFSCSIFRDYRGWRDVPAREAISYADLFRGW